MSSNKTFSNETSERYARALFEISSDLKELNSTEDNVRNFCSVLNLSPELKNFLKNPTQSRGQQIKAINLLSDKLNFSKILNNFFLLLIEKRRIFFSKKICETFIKLCSQKRGEVKVDKDLIGGLKLQLGSFMIDTSIKNKLKKFEQAMIEN